ncbi:hypothetical protein [Bacillus sp. AK031]
MRVWRVGSISMGAALIFLGLMLLFTQIFEWDTAYVLSGWWPFILIILGGEMLFYLFFSRQENTKVKYDILSILFVAVIGTAGIGFTVVQATGVMGAVHGWVSAEEKTLEIPAFSKNLSDDIKRVVVNTGPHALTIEGGTGDEVSMFGTYRSTIINGENMLKDVSDYLQFEENGDSLYITLKGLPSEPNPFGGYNEMNATLVVPASVGLEVKGNHNPITMKPRTLLSHWSVTESDDVQVMLSENSDIKLTAENVSRIRNTEKWNLAEKKSESKEYEDGDYVGAGESGTYTLGQGTYDLTISNSYGLTVMTSR